MKKKVNPKSLFQRFIDFITFVNQPIRKRFILFFFGVLWWFVVMTAISIVTLVVVNNTTHKIVDSIIPYEKLTYKITKKLHLLNIDVFEIIKAKNLKVTIEKIKVSETRIEDIKIFLLNLKHGGQVNDYSRGNSKFIESFPITPMKVNPKGEKYIKDLSPLIEAVEKKFVAIAKLKMDILGQNVGNGNGEHTDQFKVQLNEFQQLISNAVSISNEFSNAFSSLYRDNSQNIISALTHAFFSIIAVLIIATTLLIIFTVYIEKAIARPIHSIIKQIESLGEGRVDLSKKIEISSKDEIGVLSLELNALIEALHGIATFKKVIEEDNILEDVYSRLGLVFKKIGLEEFTIYEVQATNEMRPVYPFVLPGNKTYCDDDVTLNCGLCRARRVGHTISSLDFPRMCKEFHPEFEKDHICIPMVAGTNTIGVVQFLFDQSINKEIQRIEINRKIFKAEEYIKESLHVIEAKRLMNTLKDSAIRDSLTGLYNRRFLQEFIDTVLPGVLRREKNIGLIMCDLDYFKQVNDRYGHDVGDTVLKQTANIIKTSIRESDLIIRFGGEEFLVLLLDIREDESMDIAEKIRKNMEKAKLNIPNDSICKTISLGISEFPLDSESLWHAIKFCDVALYKAKESGRNKVVRFAQDMWTEESF